LAGVLILLCLSAWTGIFSHLGFFLIVVPAAFWAIIVVHERDPMFSGVQLEFLVESIFVLSGLLAFLMA
jgi:4-hydroxy-3-methylbut-2-enyl diphosphate reductase